MYQNTSGKPFYHPVTNRLVPTGAFYDVPAHQDHENVETSVVGDEAEEKARLEAEEKERKKAEAKAKREEAKAEKSTGANADPQADQGAGAQ